MSAPAPKPRRWPRRLALALLVVLAVPALIIGYGYWQEGHAWRVACAEADRLDPGWRWHELLAARPAVPDAENAALTVQAASGLLPRLWDDWSDLIRDDELPPPPPADPDEPPPAPVAAEDRRGTYGYLLEGELAQAAPNQRLHPAQAAIVRRILAAYAPAVDAADPLADQPRGCRPLDRRVLDDALADTTFTHESARSVFRLLRLRSIVQVEDGDADGALRSCRAVLNVAELLAWEPNAISPITAASFRQTAAALVPRVLGRGEPTPAALADLQRRLHEAHDASTLLPALRAVRADVETIRRAESEGRKKPLLAMIAVEIDDLPKEVTGYEAIDAWLHRLRGKGWHQSYATIYLRYLTRLIEMAKTSPDELRRRADEVAAARAALPPALEKAAEWTHSTIRVERRTRALLSTGAAAVAAERFRRERGRWPESLAELTPAYLKAAPPDPFDGQPLRLRRLADGLVIYSVGENGTDDGGNLTDDPADLGVRLWDPAQRRQPPPTRDAGR